MTHQTLFYFVILNYVWGSTYPVINSFSGANRIDPLAGLLLHVAVHCSNGASEQLAQEVWTAWEHATPADPSPIPRDVDCIDVWNHGSNQFAFCLCTCCPRRHHHSFLRSWLFTRQPLASMDRHKRRRLYHYAWIALQHPFHFRSQARFHTLLSTRSQGCITVLPFKPKYRLGHPNAFIGSKHQKKMKKKLHCCITLYFRSQHSISFCVGTLPVYRCPSISLTGRSPKNSSGCNESGFSKHSRSRRADPVAGKMSGWWKYRLSMSYLSPET